MREMMLIKVMRDFVTRAFEKLLNFPLKLTKKRF